MGTFVEEITINAPTEAVWNALADIGSIYKWNPGVKQSHMTTSSEVGLGSGRHCDLGGKNYLDETVVEWRPDVALTMRIVATNLPFKTADIKFTLDGNGQQTLVTVAPEYTLKFGMLGTLMDIVLVRSSYRKGMVNLLKGLKGYVENTEGLIKSFNKEIL